MQTSKQWWDATKHDEQALERWLTAQYIGERTAVMRLQKLAQICLEHNLPAWKRRLVKLIAGDEYKHASWVADLLFHFQFPVPFVHDKAVYEGRYWEKVLVGDKTVEDLFAVGALAEDMRLKRIRAIVEDPETHPKFREIFAKILDDEEGHAAIFAVLAGPEALARNAGQHAEGYKALGLTD